MRALMWGRAYMKKFILFLAVLTVVGLAVSYWWQENYPSGSWRYKMTVEVETPEGVKTGGAVREVSAYRFPSPFPEDPVGHTQLVYGEAIVVDLGERGVLFALLTGPSLGVDYAQTLPFYVFPSAVGGTTAAGIKHYRALITDAVDLMPGWYPFFIHFKDISDRKTVELVRTIDQSCIIRSATKKDRDCVKEDRFSDVFGDGVRLKAVRLRMTKEPVTKGVVDRYLSWLAPWQDRRAKLPTHTIANSKDWDGASDPVFAQAAVAALKKRSLLKLWRLTQVSFCLKPGFGG